MRSDDVLKKVSPTEDMIECLGNGGAGAGIDGGGGGSLSSTSTGPLPRLSRAATVK